MSLDDTLRDLMAERSDGRAVPVGHLDRIHHRLVRRRTRRLGVAAAGTVLALAALTGTVIAWPQGTTTDEPSAFGDSAPPSPTLPALTLPDRDHGQSLVQQKFEPLSPGRGEFTLVFTPQRWNFSISMDCVTTAVPADYQIEILINSSRLPYVVATCNQTSDRSALPDQPPTDDEQRNWWQQVHSMIEADTPVRLNEPMTITVRVGAPEEKDHPRGNGKIVRSGLFTARSGQAIVGIYQPG